MSVSSGLGLTEARAYTIGTHITDNCHERITAEALRNARGLTRNPLMQAPTADEQALIDDVQFTLEDDLKDLDSVTLLLGVRDNDLKGNSQDDLTRLSQVHGNPTNQQEHCLRSPGQVEPGGTAASVAACQTFILKTVADAIDGLDKDGYPDNGKRTPLGVHLSIRGRVDAPLPTFYVRMGQGMHALQDSFTHTYRTPDSTKITVALDWIDSVNGTLVESVNGPAHAKALDDCSDPDALRKTRRQLATLASTKLLTLALGNSKSKGEKLLAIHNLLDTYVGYSPGCTFQNGWCGAPEVPYKDSKTLGCTTGGSGNGSGAVGVMLGVLGLGLAFLRRRARAGQLGWVVVGMLALSSGSARAQSTPPTEKLPTVADHPVTTGTDDLPASGIAWGAYVGAGGSFQAPGFALDLGARLQLSHHWTVGLDVEANPWVAYNGTTLGKGVVSYFGTGIFHVPLAYEDFSLRVTLSVGASTLWSSLYGAPAGTTGLYFAVYPLGVDWRLTRDYYLIVNPLGIAVPAPQLQGVPLLYPQYRFTIGLGFFRG